MLGANRLSHRSSLDSTEDIDPMNSLGNLADAMLVMAVGLMLALVSAWQLDFADIHANIEIADETQDLDIDSDPDDPTLSEYGLSEYGKVFVDEDGTYYMVENSDRTSDAGSGDASSGDASSASGASASSSSGGTGTGSTGGSSASGASSGSSTNSASSAGSEG